MFFNRRKTEFKINYLPFLGVVLLLNFPRAVNAQTNSCPWAGEDQEICLDECTIIGCETSEGVSELCFLWVSDTDQLNENEIHSNRIEVCPIISTTYTL